MKTTEFQYKKKSKTNTNYQISNIQNYRFKRKVQKSFLKYFSQLQVNIGSKMAGNKNTPAIRSFAYEFRPIYYFARVCGQMPFTITYHTKGATVGVKMNKCDFIWLAITVFIHISFIFWSIEILKSTSDPNSHRYNLYFGNLILWFLILLLGISHMVCSSLYIYQELVEWNGQQIEFRFQISGIRRMQPLHNYKNSEQNHHFRRRGT